MRVEQYRRGGRFSGKAAEVGVKIARDGLGASLTSADGSLRVCLTRNELERLAVLTMCEPLDPAPPDG